MATVLNVDRVSKAFRIARQKPFLARELLRSVLQRPASVELHWALRDVSFSVAEGESIGVIGTNGSGKSTLLSLIARTSYPSTGTIEVNGRVGPLLELGAGFHPDLTGYENVFLNAALLGLSRDEVASRLDAIIDYSGIRDFIHAPLHTYSTGMQARLGFAVVAHVEPDILLVDEALSVGDAAFQVQCERTIQQFLARGKTLFLVSHSLPTVQQLCRRTLWLHKGEVRELGPSEQVCANYLRFASTPTS